MSVRWGERLSSLTQCALCGGAVRWLSGQQGKRSEGTRTQNPPGSGNVRCKSDRGQVIGGKLLIGQLAPWVTWDIRQKLARLDRVRC